MTAVRETQVAIVGAGPGGLAAAIELVRRGARVLLLDENPRPGGQIFRQAPANVSVEMPRALRSPNHQRGHELLAQVAALGIEVVSGALVWDAEPGSLSLEIAGRAQLCRWQHLILATGAYDRSVAFPGWTLPGVITAGAAQVMVRGQLITPGTRALVAGTGPLLLPTVAALVAAGVEIVAVLEASGRRRALSALPAILGNRARRREAMHYLAVLRRGRVRYRSGWSIFSAHGEDRVQRAVIGKVDRRGVPRRDTATEVAADVVCVGFGLQPSIELAARLGCELRHSAVRGGWVANHDPHMATNVSGVRVAGEVAGIGGADVAMAEGRIAGLAIAAAEGWGDRREVELALQGAICQQGRERRTSDRLLRAFSIPPGLHQLADDDTMVCRCEDVTLAALRAGVEIGGRDLRSAKMATRAGMGPCQGRICQALIGDLLVHRCGGAQAPSPPVVQAPIKPVSVETFTRLER